MAFDWLEFRRGVVDILPVVTAALPIGLLFGTLAAAKGITPVEAMVMSATVFAGAAQFVAVDLWTNPAPVLLLTLTVFLVNIRHIMMGVSSRQAHGEVPAMAAALGDVLPGRRDVGLCRAACPRRTGAARLLVGHERGLVGPMAAGDHRRPRSLAAASAIPGTSASISPSPPPSCAS